MGGPPRQGAASRSSTATPTKVHVVTRNRYGRERAYYAEFEGVRTYIERRHREAESDTSRERFEGFMREVPVPRLPGQPAQAGLDGGDPGRPATPAARTSPRSARCRSTRPPTTSATSSCPPASARSASGCSRRSRSGSTSCSTSASTTSRSTGPPGSLSGGEAQRIRLATQIGAGLVGVLYVLDEPSIGLHQRDNQRLIETLVRLKDLGNTLIVVEHDEDTIRAADWVVDIGPGAGEHGGQVVHSGTVDGPARATPTR